MNIREAKKLDLDQLSILFDSYRMFYGKESNTIVSKNFLENRLSNKDSKLFICEVNNILTGFVQLYPIVINKIKKIIFHFIYFYYVGIVMVITYLERIRGNFEGAEPELFHYIGLVSIIISLLAFGLYFNKYRRLINN